jgi:glutamate-1-semialdehyde 2,1-aminomutase
MTVHGRRGPIRSVDDLATSDDRLKELLFLDLLERGYYIARRGFVALSLPLIDADLDGFLAAVDACIGERAAVLARAA